MPLQRVAECDNATKRGCYYREEDTVMLLHGKGERDDVSKKLENHVVTITWRK